LLVAALLTLTLGGAGIGSGCSFPGGTLTEPPLQLSAVSGRVTHVLTSAPIGGVTVRVTPNGQPAADVTTNSNGIYFRAAISNGPARIEVHAAGYRDYVANITLNVGENTHDIQLIPNP
jgi:hypothetical protein